MKCIHRVPIRSNREDASEDASEDESRAWQAAILMFIVCKIKKELPIDLSRKGLAVDLNKKGFDCDRLSAQQHTDVPTAIENLWQQLC